MKPGREKPHLFLVDDHPLFRKGLRYLLETEASELYEVCGEAGDGIDALEMMSEAQPDVLITDIELPRMNGLELLRRAVEDHPDLVAIVMSVHDGNIFAERALSAGALAYLKKDETGDSLLSAIETVLGGEVWLNAELTQSVLKRIAKRGKSTSLEESIRDLSDRELQVFAAIGRGMTNAQIATDLFIGAKTVETHKRRIQKKLGLESGKELVLHALQWNQHNV